MFFTEAELHILSGRVSAKTDGISALHDMVNTESIQPLSKIEIRDAIGYTWNTRKLGDLPEGLRQEIEQNPEGIIWNGAIHLTGVVQCS